MSPGVLWLLLLESGQLPPVEYWYSVLGLWEQKEIAAFQMVRDRQVASLSRGSARFAASAAVNGTVHPKAWSFARAPTGRRILCAPDGQEMNICVADNESLLVIGAGLSTRIGVDVESRQYRFEWRNIAARFFSLDEQRLLDRLSDEKGSNMFLLLWTGKEAFAKALNTDLVELLCFPLVDPDQDLAQLWCEGLSRDGWKFQWANVGDDVVAICGDANARFLDKPLLMKCPSSLASTSFYVATENGLHLE